MVCLLTATCYTYRVSNFGTATGFLFSISSYLASIDCLRLSAGIILKGVKTSEGWKGTGARCGVEYAVGWCTDNASSPRIRIIAAHFSIQTVSHAHGTLYDNVYSVFHVFRVRTVIASMQIQIHVEW